MLPFLSAPPAATCWIPPEPDTASLMFRGSQILTRTPGTTGNRRTWTLMMIVQRTRLGLSQMLFGTRNLSGSGTALWYSGDEPRLYHVNDITYPATDRHRDPQGWLFLTLAVDTTAPVAADRQRLWVGNRPVDWLGSSPLFAQNIDTEINQAGVAQQIGGGSSGFRLDGLMAEVMLVDGAVLTPAAFFSPNIHGVLVRRPRSEIYAAVTAAGGWGTNGFHLDFSAPLAPGTDVSGQGNHWTAVGFDAAGADAVASTPTNTYATLNPLSQDAGVTISEGGLRSQQPSASTGRHVSTLAVPPSAAAAIRAEVTVLSLASASARDFGVVPMGWDPTISGYLQGGVRYAGQQGQVLSATDAVLASGLPATSAEDTVGIVLSQQAGTVAFYLRRADSSVADLGTYPLGALSGQSLRFAGASGHAHVYRWNFGQRPFLRSLPAGGLCTANLPEVAVQDPAEGLAIATGTGANLPAVLEAATVTWGGWVEIVKRRDASEDWRWRFSDDPGNALSSSTSAGRVPAPALVPTGAYVGTRFRLGGKHGAYSREVTHTTGTDTIVTHGLGTRRALILVKPRGAAGGDWFCWHPDLPEGSLLRLNTTAPAAADGTITAVTANGFTLPAALSSGTLRVVVFAERRGLLTLGAYTGTGQADTAGPFVPMEISPLLMMQRRIDAAGSCEVLDTVREPSNPAYLDLLINTAAPDNTNSNTVDLVTGGAKVRTNPAFSGSSDSNATGSRHVHVAWGRACGGQCVAPPPAR